MSRIPKSITLPSQMFRKPRGVLRNIYTEARILLDIQAAVKEVVAVDIQVGALEKGKLHLIASSASVATRIKYSQKTIIGALKAQQLPQPVNSIKVSVRPKFETSPVEVRNAIPPNQENSRRLKLAAEHIEDEDLRNALLKLSNRAIQSD